MEMQSYTPEMPQTNVESVGRVATLRHFRSALSIGGQEIRLANIVYPAALATSIATWFFAIGSPLWLDETISYWQTSGGFFQVWARQGLSFPAYPYILLATRTLFGSSEFVLRLPSILAMLAAAWVLFCSAREFFEADVALITTIVFCAYPTIVFAAIDARPYAFGVLAVNCSILSLLRWTRTGSTAYSVLFGIAAASIFYFHYLFGVILVAFAAFLVTVKPGANKKFRRQITRASLASALVMVPVVPRLIYLFRTSHSHVFSLPPTPNHLAFTFAPDHMLPLFGVVALIAAAAGKMANPDHAPSRAGVACLLFAIVPIAILYGVSVSTSLHIFVERYQLVAVPGIALCWGLLLRCINSTALRIAFCLAMVVLTAKAHFEAPSHGYTWKYALEAANRNASSDGAPLLVCSDLPEADYQPIPSDPSTSGLFGQLSYYKVNSPVIPLPRVWNGEAKSQVHDFLATATPARRRFLVVAFRASHLTIQRIAETAKDSYTAHTLGVWDDVSVVEYVPR